jgi:hypothetical protein
MDRSDRVGMMTEPKVKVKFVDRSTRSALFLVADIEPWLRTLVECKMRTEIQGAEHFVGSHTHMVYL